MAPITIPAALTRPTTGLDRAGPSAIGEEGAGGSFADALGKAIGQVDRLQTDADKQVEDVAMGKGNLHETALALEKADVAMKLSVKVRNKLVEAYQDVMRMGI